MTAPQVIAVLAASLLISRWLMQFWLSRLNQRHVEAHAREVPPAFKETMDPATYAKSVEYTMAHLRLGRVSDTLDLVLVGVLLFSGVLPWALDRFVAWQGDSAWAMAGFLLGVGVAVSVTGWPLAWYEQFHLEQRFGFNTMTGALWWLDRLKGLLLTALLGYPLLVLMLKIVRWTGEWWWLWAWGCLVIFQLVMTVLAPVVILPLFNKFTPLPEGSLRQRLLELASRTGFLARSIQVMDGSKRSRHSNAFFTGFGRWRKIVLFDTLLQQLSESEVEAVLAHEIGHYRLKHVPKLVAGSVAGLFAAFFVLSRLAQEDWFYRAFGFLPGAIEPALLVFTFLAGAVIFWVSPVFHLLSRRFEYEADGFAGAAMKEAGPMIRALRKLNEKNLSNLTPHPLYSGFYYSHPTLMERETALTRRDFGAG